MTRQFHEVANIFPLMQGDEFEALKADIASNGQREPIWLHTDGSIIDGRNRYRACMDLDIQPVFRTWDGKGSLVAFVVSLNLHRRHLTPMQRAAVAVDILPMLESEAKERQGRRTDLQPVGPNLWGDNIYQKIDESRKEPQATEQAAQMLGTNRQYVSDAKRYKEEAPEVYEMAKAGVINGSEAKQLANLDGLNRATALQMLGDGSAETVRDAVSVIKRQERIEKINAISEGNAEIAETLGRFPFVYADPPWRYEHVKTNNRAIENHYPTMDLGEICALPVHEITTDDCVLFLWATSPKLEESMQVINSWGFTYRTCMVWDKEKIGMGYYARQQHELLLIATKGSPPVPTPESRPPSVVRCARGEHSAKPEIFYELIERMYPDFRKVELFARNRRDGWQVWGNQS